MIPQSVKITMSILIVSAIFLFLVIAAVMFVKEYYADFKKKKKTRRDTIQAASMSKGHLQMIRRFGGLHGDNTTETANGEEQPGELGLGETSVNNASKTKVAPIVQPL